MPQNTRCPLWRKNRKLFLTCTWVRDVRIAKQINTWWWHIFLFISKIKKGKDILLLRSFLTLQQIKRTLRPIKKEEIAGKLPVPEKRIRTDWFEKFAADKPRRACAETLWIHQSFIGINNVPMTSWPWRADETKRHTGKKSYCRKIGLNKRVEI